ncbi:MAG: hypothetical protein ABTQ73_13635 [Caldilineales bacterium]
MSSTRAALIERKQAVIAEIEQARRAQARLLAVPATARRRREIEARLDALMAEEARLRLAIDRTSQ